MFVERKIQTLPISETFLKKNPGVDKKVLLVPYTLSIFSNFKAVGYMQATGLGARTEAKSVRLLLVV